MRTLALCLLTLPLFSARCGAEEPFEPLGFEAALEKARASGRVVLVDFFTTWCAPCKKLDQTTWSDPRVRKWLAEKTVALKIDAEKESKLASRFHVAAYPTIVFVKANGEELDRLVGYRTAEDFLSEANDALAGKDSLTRAREKLAGRENDPSARADFADVLAQKGLYAEALEQYLWCFDHGLEHEEAYAGVRLSFLLADIVELAKKYPPARAALVERRDRRESAPLEELQEFAHIQELTALNKYLGDQERSLALFDRLVEQDAPAAAARRILADLIGEDLMRSKRYAPYLAAVGDPLSCLERKVRNYQTFLEFEARQAESEGQATSSPAEYMKGSVVRFANLLYEATLGAGRPDDASKVLEFALAFDGSVRAWTGMIEAAVRAGDLDQARALVERASAAVPPDDRKKIERAGRKISEPEDR